jgi:hypothetical protein
VEKKRLPLPLITAWLAFILISLVPIAYASQYNGLCPLPCLYRVRPCRYNPQRIVISTVVKVHLTILTERYCAMQELVFLEQDEQALTEVFPQGEKVVILQTSHK